MKSKKVTMLAAALVVAVVAAAGIGYAAVTSYKATTENTNNALDSTYLTVTQSGGEGAGAYTYNFLKNLYFDSENTAENVTKYTPVYDCVVGEEGGTVSEETTGANMAKISKDLSLKIVPTNSDAENVSITVTTENFHHVTGFTYTMVLLDTTGKIVKKVTNNNTDGWSFGTVALNQEGDKAADTTYTVMLFLSGSVTTSSTVSMNEHAGFAPSTATGTDLTKFTFTVEAQVTSS